MLPSAALPALPTHQLSVEPGLQPALPSPENSQFAAILAGTAELSIQPLTCLQELLGETGPEPVPAGQLPDCGKELPEPASAPIAMPDAATVLALLPLPMAQPDPAAPLPTRVDTPPLAARLPLPAAALRPYPPLTITAPRPDQPVLAAAPPSLSIPAPPPAQTFGAKPRSITLASIAPTTPATVSPASVIPAAPQRDPSPREPAAVLTVTSPLLSPSGADRAAPAKAPLEASFGIGANLPPLQPLALVTTANPAPDAPFTTPAVMQGPQDFAQLIDRLVAARETAQPQMAAVALSHSDFGPVELRFSHDSQGLSVTMASNDPDFARAVQAAVPPAAPASDSAAMQSRQQGQGSGAQGWAGGQSPGHQSGQSGAGPGRPPEHRAATPAEGPASAAPDDQSGIFA